MINKMQTKMINHIIKAKIPREENLLSKIKSVLEIKKNYKSSKSKNIKNKIDTEEEYKFIATDNTLPIDKEESKANNIINKKNSNNENDLIKVTENAFVNDSNFLSKNNENDNNNFDEKNYNSRLSQQNELLYKSSKESK